MVGIFLARIPSHSRLCRKQLGSVWGEGLEIWSESFGSRFPPRNGLCGRQPEKFGIEGERDEGMV